MLQVQGAGVGYNRGYQQPRGPQYYADRGCVPLALAAGDSRLGTKVGDTHYSDMLYFRPLSLSSMDLFFALIRLIFW